MKTKDLNDIRKKDIEELRKTVEEKKEDLRKVNLDTTLGQEDNPKKAKLIKKDIAQIMTIVKEKLLLEKIQTKQSEEKKGDKK